MGTKDSVEACGRCTMSTAVDTTDGEGKNPFDGDRIEVAEDDLRAVSGHVVYLRRLADQLNKWATRLTYGR